MIDLDLYEAFTRSDGKIAYRLRDQSVGYRSDELRPEVAALLQKCRDKNLYPSRAFIDKVIVYQNESPEKAARYIRYIKLGEIAHADVFGAAAQEEYKAEKFKREIEKLRAEVSNLADLKKDVSEIKEILLRILEK